MIAEDKAFDLLLKLDLLNPTDVQVTLVANFIRTIEEEAAAAVRQVTAPAAVEQFKMRYEIWRSRVDGLRFAVRFCDDRMSGVRPLLAGESCVHRDLPLIEYRSEDVKFDYRVMGWLEHNRGEFEVIPRESEVTG